MALCLLVGKTPNILRRRELFWLSLVCYHSNIRHFFIQRTASIHSKPKDHSLAMEHQSVTKLCYSEYCPWNSSLTNIWELCRISGSTEASNITVLSGIIKVFKTLCIRYSPNTRGKINLTTERFWAHSLGLHSIQVGKSEPGLWGSRFIVPEI